MELQQLRYLRAAVRLGSVTRAAEAEHVAQPSVSKQLRALEREVGVPLFHRVGRRIIPTDAGLRLADTADHVLRELEEAAGALAGESGKPQSLAICATETVVDHLLPAAIAGLMAEHPGLRLSVEMLGTEAAVARLLADEADFAIAVLPVADARLEVHTLLDEDVLLAVPRGHSWAGRAGVPLSEALAAGELLLSMRGLGLRATVEAEAARWGVALAGRLELRSQQALLALVAAGAGIAFAPRMALAGRADVVAVRTEPVLRRSLGWMRRRGRYLPPAAFDLVERCRGAEAG
ncbi:MAG: LysR family transcriptional regulator [Dehalococcoidia bacterium]|nr:LysR family transcriptional regulator [Dehalococcoidia bacterium]